MNDFVKFIEEVKKKFDIPNDLQLSAFLGISTNMTYRMARGLSIPGDENCIQIAKVTGYDPAYVLALAHKCSSKSQDVTKVWNQILKKLSPVALAIILFSLSLPESAASGTAKENTTIVYLIRHI